MGYHANHQQFLSALLEIVIHNLSNIQYLSNLDLSFTLKISEVSTTKKVSLKKRQEIHISNRFIKKSIVIEHECTDSRISHVYCIPFIAHSIYLMWICRPISQLTFLFYQFYLICIFQGGHPRSQTHIFHPRLLPAGEL